MSERTENRNIPRATVYAQISAERAYQNDEEVSDNIIITVGDELKLLATCLREAESRHKMIQSLTGGYGDLHEASVLYSIRKLAAICVRTMEHHGEREGDPLCPNIADGETEKCEGCLHIDERAIGNQTCVKHCHKVYSLSTPRCDLWEWNGGINAPC